MDVTLYIALDLGRTPLHEAILRGHNETALALIAAGADGNIRFGFGFFFTVILYIIYFSGDTPLHLKIFREHYDVALALIAAGADVNVTDGKGIPLTL